MNKNMICNGNPRPGEEGARTYIKAHLSVMLITLQEEFEPVFMVVFTVEMCTRILSMGFILHKNSYMRNMWNIMDFFVVTSG